MEGRDRQQQDKVAAVERVLEHAERKEARGGDEMEGRQNGEDEEREIACPPA